MTSEEKELLLKDLCARLPYRVKISIPELWTSEKTIEVFNEIFKGDDGEFRCNDSGMLIKYVKPYLFPFSSMTEEQEKEYLNTCNGYCTYYWTEETFDWLNKNHFDYRDLIEKSLALDATNLGIYE